jgi:D-sedoheptulose 7-phosphate isomerase
MIDLITSSLSEAQTALANLLANQKALASIEAGARLLIDCLAADGHIYSCGNGGSMCDAMHFAEEMTGRYRDNRAPLAALAIADASHLSCVGNDYGYEEVFSRFVTAHGRTGDVLVAISTSGTSKNVIKAAEAARARGMKVLAMTGREGGPLAALADVVICTPGGRYADRVQEQHIKVIHILIELCERHFFPEIYPAG